MKEIENVPFLGGLVKVVSAPIKLIGNTTQATASLFTGDTEGFKDGLGGAVNNIFDVVEAPLQMTTDVLEVPKTVMGGNDSGNSSGFEKITMGTGNAMDIPIGTVQIVQDAINAIRPSRKGFGENFEIKEKEPKQEAPENKTPQNDPAPKKIQPREQVESPAPQPPVAKTPETPKKVNSDDSDAKNTNSKLKTTISEAQQINDELEKNIIRAKEENERLEENIERAKGKDKQVIVLPPPNVSQNNDKTNWKLIGAIATGFLAVGVLFALKGKGKSTIAKLFKRSPKSANVKSFDIDIDKLLKEATKKSANSTIQSINKNAISKASTYKVRTPEEIAIINKARAHRLKRAERRALAAQAKAARKAANAQKVAKKEAIEKARKLAKQEDYMEPWYHSMTEAPKQTASTYKVRTQEEIAIINKARARRLKRAERRALAAQAKAARKAANAQKVAEKELADKKYSEAVKLNRELTQGVDNARRAENRQLREDIIKRSKFQRRQEARQLAQKNQETKMWEDRKIQQKTEEARIADQKNALWEAHELTQTQAQTNLQARTNREITQYMEGKALPIGAQKEQKTPKLTLVKAKAPKIVPATLEQKPMGTLAELLPQVSAKLDALRANLSSTQAVLTLKKGKVVHMGDKVKIKLNSKKISKTQYSEIKNAIRSLMGGKVAGLPKNQEVIEITLNSSNLGQIRKLRKYLEITAA